MKRSSPTRLEGRFLHLVYSPRGEIEGIMLQAGSAPAQVVFDRDDETPAALFQDLQEGQVLAMDASLAEPSPKGQGDHVVYAFRKLLKVDGAAPVARPSEAGSGYRGRVQRFNYARHGAINGVVLDSGDFLHFKPEGYAQLALKVGDQVEADGDAQQLADGRGWAVEATTVNGHPVARH